ncbi:peroxidase family protein [Purpureocillium lilacinum]|uniref:Peroxidase family protein n=1 Tax=Purpureocillium lilacinum TaxID=33203 RepID=A0A179FKZ6_PURLI|nr:peroxidase family protein [Purpureocillium lilacinum]OAQ65679.1 peroxidase family protein [Purpureocillium lilacinum]GJN72434.1 hypothetical protein PLICBS_006507 [Purpureocillium lilacinum]
MGDPSAAYTILRMSSFYERMFYTFHRFGIQSNILVSARYTCGDDRPLSKWAVYNALASVIKTHPALRVVGVQRPSPRPGRHRIFRAVLHKIEFDTCVEFVADDQGDGVTSATLEEAHNTWDWADDEPGTPWWKLIIVGGNHIVFVYHHFVGDGISGVTFHREFLAALNTLGPSPDSGTVSPDHVAYSPSTILQYPPEPTDIATDTPSILRLVWNFLVWWLLRLFFQKRLLFGDLPRPRPYTRSLVAHPGDGGRTTTTVATCRIPAAKVRHIILACREKQTTFTPLLVTMLNLTLSTDFYPSALIGASRVAFDLRSHLSLSGVADISPNGIIMNAAAAAVQLHWLPKYKRDGAVDDQGLLPCHNEAIWQLARTYKKDMDAGVHGCIRDWMASKLVGPDLEDFTETSLPMIGHMVSDTYLVSNLGSIAGRQHGVSLRTRATKEGWAIDEMQFSAAATNGHAGSRSFALNIVGVADGDTIINASFEKGMVSKEMVDAILDRTMMRIERLLE